MDNDSRIYRLELEVRQLKKEANHLYNMVAFSFGAIALAIILAV